MPITFRKAVRENVSLLIGLAGPSGAGKTFSAMRLASGLAGGKRFAVVDTENGRASHYGDDFDFDVTEIRAPFEPKLFSDAIKAADDAGYPVIIVDSASLEYSGDGGVLDMQEAEFQRLGGRDSAKMLSWVPAKREHKKMMQRILQTRAHLILCFRAEPKIEVIKEDGKTKIVPKQSLVGLDGYIPIAEKNMPYELTVSLLLTPDKPGVPKPIKLQKAHAPMFPLDAPITEESGKRILEWAKGGAAPSTVGSSSGEPVPGAGATITVNQAADIEAYCSEHSIPLKGLLDVAKVTSVHLLPDFARAKRWIDKQIAAREVANRG